LDKLVRQVIPRLRPYVQFAVNRELEQESRRMPAHVSATAVNPLDVELQFGNITEDYQLL